MQPIGIEEYIILCMLNKMVCSTQRQVKPIERSDIPLHYVIEWFNGNGDGTFSSVEIRLFKVLDTFMLIQPRMRCC